MDETTETAETVAAPKLDLVCPYCGGQIYVEMETVGPAYLTYERAESITCQGSSTCNAEWSPVGVLVSQPLYVLYPDVYERPSQ